MKIWMNEDRKKGVDGERKKNVCNMERMKEDVSRERRKNECSRERKKCECGGESTRVYGKQERWERERRNEVNRRKERNRNNRSKKKGEGKVRGEREVEEIKIVGWNVAGVKNKKADFWEYIRGFDVIGLMETWIEKKEWEDLKAKLPEGWNWKCQEAERKHRKGRAMGGIITGIRKELVEIIGEREEEEGIQERRIETGGVIWRIINVYNREGRKETLENIKKEVKEDEEENMIILGDFNARIGIEGGWEESEIVNEVVKRNSKDKKINGEGREMLKMVEERGWIIMNGQKRGDEMGEWTYEKDDRKTVIDYGIVNWSAWERIKELKVGDRIESDHQPIEVLIKNKWKKEEIEESSVGGQVQDWTEEGEKKYRENIQKVRWKETEGGKEWKELQEEIKKAMSRKEKTKKRGLGWVPWWDRECKVEKRKAHKARREYRKDQEEGKYREYIKKRKDYRELCERKKKEYMKREEKEVEKIRTEKQAWNFINKNRKRRQEISKEITMEKWEKFFMETLGGDKQIAIAEKRIERDRRGDEEVEMEKVYEEIKRLKKDKAAGIDELKNEVWISGGEKVWKKLGEVIKKVWSGEGIPEEWRTGMVVPIWKRGEKKDVKNYRGVTLMCTSYKIYTNILNKRIVEELDDKNGWGRSQAGFRKGRSTIENIKILKYLIGRRIKDKRKLWVFFADLKAAFDNIDRAVLWDMMKKRGITESIIDRVREIYEDTRCRVRIGDEETEEFRVKKGVRQGCPLSPTLFNIYIADIEEEMEKGPGGVKVGSSKVWTLEYADDIVMVAEEEGQMRVMLRMLKGHLERKKLELSTEKSKVVVFQNDGGRKKVGRWWWGKEKIEEVKEIKYLGYIMKSNNKEDGHIRERVRKARIAMGWIWSFGERKFKGDIRWRVKLFDSIVKGILLYGVEIWGYKEWKEVEKLQEKYLRWILKLDGTTPGYVVREELKREKIRIEAGKRAGWFEDKMECGKVGEIGQRCIKERRREEKEREEKDWTKESIERRNYLWRCGRSEEALQEEGEDKWTRMKDRDTEVDEQERGFKVSKSKSCEEYRWVQGIPEYIRRNKNRTEGKKIQRVARWRCGNETKGNKYWLKDEERRCRLCGWESESVRHLKVCVGLDGENEDEIDVLNEDGRGYEWMVKVERKRMNEGEINKEND